MKRLVTFAVLLALAAGLALAQDTHIAPQLVFDTSAFDYAPEETGYLHFTRNVEENILLVTLDHQNTPGSLAFYPCRPMEGTPIVETFCIDVSRRSIEIPFDATRVTYDELLGYFHDLIPTLGFVPQQELFAGNTYIYDCDCAKFAETGLRFSMERFGDVIYVRMVLQVPFAY